MKTFIYAAYGSNLHPCRLKAHDRCPSAKLLGTSTIIGWRLTFRKRSTDGSVKCDAENTCNPLDKLLVAVYEILESEESALDKAEGLGSGYNKSEIELTFGGKNFTAKIYLADKKAIVTDAPYDWYKQMVLLGAKYHGFPDMYTNKINGIASKIDSNNSRALQQWAEVERMKTANKNQPTDIKQSCD